MEFLNFFKLILLFFVSLQNLTKAYHLPNSSQSSWIMESDQLVVPSDDQLILNTNRDFPFAAKDSQSSKSATIKQLFKSPLAVLKMSKRDVDNEKSKPNENYIKDLKEQLKIIDEVTQNINNAKDMEDLIRIVNGYLQKNY